MYDGIISHSNGSSILQCSRFGSQDLAFRMPSNNDRDYNWTSLKGLLGNWGAEFLKIITYAKATGLVMNNGDQL